MKTSQESLGKEENVTSFFTIFFHSETSWKWKETKLGKVFACAKDDPGTAEIISK